MTRPKLRLVGGVCAGFAEHTGVPVSAVRTATLILTFCGGFGVLLYAWLWATVPSADSGPVGAQALPKSRLVLATETRSPAFQGSAPEVVPGNHANSTTADAASARSAPVSEILLGVALLAAGVALIAGRLGADIPLAVVIPAIVVLAGISLAWRQFADIRSGAAKRSSALLMRTLGALVLVAVGILLFFVTGEEPDVWTVVIAAVSVLLGMAVVLAPWFIRLSGDLVEEREARVRESERAEIAAHLHDSVLQTLALIQQKAGPQSDAARLARAQERELREWLFTGAGTAPVDLAAELRRIAGVIEEDFAVHFEVVTVGASTQDVPEGLVAAAREAMLNAARHAGGSVSVYLESSSTGTELSITDRGPGFSLADIPEDRMGIRESILGRMRRVGGSAAVRPGPGGQGTEIHLTLPALVPPPPPVPVAQSVTAAHPDPAAHPAPGSQPPLAAHPAPTPEPARREFPFRSSASVPPGTLDRNGHSGGPEPTNGETTP